jgi:hypothetical protein
MARLLDLLQDYMGDDHRTLAVLACTEAAAAPLARPLLEPLKQGQHLFPDSLFIVHLPTGAAADADAAAAADAAASRVA